MEVGKGLKALKSLQAEMFAPEMVVASKIAQTFVYAQDLLKEKLN